MMWTFGVRRCRCGHQRKVHLPEWGWTNCTAEGCRCIQFRWVRAGWYWDYKYRQDQRRG